MSSGGFHEEAPPSFLIPPPPVPPFELSDISFIQECQKNMLTDSDLLHLSSYLIVGCIVLLLVFSTAACSLRCCTKSRVPSFHNRQHDWQEDHLLDESLEAGFDDRNSNIIRGRRRHNSDYQHKYDPDEKGEIVDAAEDVDEEEEELAGRRTRRSSARKMNSSEEGPSNYKEIVRQKVAKVQRAAGHLLWLTTSAARSNGIDLSHERWDEPTDQLAAPAGQESLLGRPSGQRGSELETLNQSSNFIPSVSGQIIEDVWQLKR